MLQLSVFVENEIGSLGKVTTILKQNHINIKAVSSFDSPDFSIMRIVVEQPEEAKSVLSDAGYLVKVTKILAVELKDQPGDLDRVLNMISNEGLNVNYIYSFVLRNGQAPLMVMNVDDMKKAKEVLIKNNVIVVE